MFWDWFIINRENSKRQFEQFKKVEKVANIDYEKVQWLKCLSYFQIGKNTEAIQLLKEIEIEKTHKHQKDAVAILNKINTTDIKENITSPSRGC